MNKTIITLLGVALLALPLLGKHHKKGEDGFVSLYNGKDLTNWKTTGNWIPQKDGSLLIHPRPGEKGWQRYDAYLTSEKKYKDFILQVEYKYPKGGNSGVYFRIGDPKDPVNTGIECQILDSTGKPDDKMGHHDHGGIIRTVGPTKNMSKKPGEWNKMIVTCKGYHLQVNLNGEDIVDIQLDKKGRRKTIWSQRSPFGRLHFPAGSRRTQQPPLSQHPH